MLQKNQFGFNAFWWEQLHTEEQIQSCVQFLAKVGYKYVEFKRDSFSQKNLGAEFKMAVEAAGKAGLKVSNFVVLRDPVNGGQKAVEDVIETIEACSQAGVGILNSLWGGSLETIAGAPEDWWMPAQANQKKGFDLLIPALEKICAAAKKNNVTMAFETIAGTLVHDYYSIQEVFRRFDHPNLCVTMDPSHLLIHRNDIPYAVRELGKKIKHVHLKDAVGKIGVFDLDFMFLSPGVGAIDWVAFFKALDDINYQGALSVEYEQFKYAGQVRKNDPEYFAKTTYEDVTALYELAYGKK
jgi:sugar phosphate isomerase/epimerase